MGLPDGIRCSAGAGGRRDGEDQRGVEVGELQVFEEGAYRPAEEGEDLDYVGCVFFSDPDGNRWCVQQIPARN